MTLNHPTGGEPLERRSESMMGSFRLNSYKNKKLHFIVGGDSDLKVYEPGIVPNTLLIKFSSCKVFDRFYNDTIRLSENMIPSSNVHVAYGMCYNN